VDITKVYVINAPVARVWKALTNADCIELWGAGPAQMRDEVGASFSLWGGDIHGTVTEIVAEQRLVEDWYGGPWPAPSVATFTLEPVGEATRLTLTHTGVPDDEGPDFAAGWDDFYLGPLKECMEG
jgi:uncharacterized protein YndB with AHSA1/START domain